MKELVTEITGMGKDNHKEWSTQKEANADVEYVF